MDADTKQRLSDVAKAKRGVLLKDCTPLDINVAIDKAIEDGVLIEDGNRSFVGGCYLVYASPEQVATFAARLPYRVMEIPAGPTMRVVKVFQKKVIEYVLKFLTGPNWPKYRRM